MIQVVTTEIAINFSYIMECRSTNRRIPTVSLQWKHTPNQSLSDPKALPCHGNSLALMTTVAIKCVLLVVGCGAGPTSLLMWHTD